MFTIRYRDGIGRWSRMTIAAADAYEATMIAIHRGVWPWSVT